MSRRRLPWPSSQIERDVFHSLRLLAKRQRKPVSAVMANAVAEYVTSAELVSTAPQGQGHGARHR